MTDEQAERLIAAIENQTARMSERTAKLDSLIEQYSNLLTEYMTRILGGSN